MRNSPKRRPSSWKVRSVSPAVPSSTLLSPPRGVFSALLSAPRLPVPAFSQVLSGLWDVNEGDTVVNPRQFYNIFKEAVPYFSGYR